MANEEYEKMKKKALEQLRSGESLFGKDGAFAPLLKEFLESALEGEMEAHLDADERIAGNKRNGKKSKRVKSRAGTFDIQTPQDRHSSFDPKIVKKREQILADSLEEKIIGLYGLGMSFRDISAHIKEMYDTDISHTALSEITDRVVPRIRAWQSRPLDSMYTIVWLDAMFYKVRHEGQVVSRALYNVLGVNRDGYKDLLGMYVAESEGSKFWLQVLTDLQNRGVEDILIASIDNLSGFSEAIESIFPKAEVQTCIIHQIRNSIKYIATKESKSFMKDLKRVYQADTKDQAELELEALESKWGAKYPIVIKSWKHNWDRLSTFFKYSKPIRRLIYTTNPIEGYHRQIRKVTKSKGAFPSDQALIKLVWLASQRAAKKWTAPIRGWRQMVQQLKIHFGDRMPMDIL